MRMVLHKTAHLTLALLIVAVFAACASFAKAQTAAQKKPSYSKSGGSSHRSKSLRLRRSKRWERGQKAPAPERISEIQQALSKDGSYTGAPNGKWDAATVEAMKKFQESHGLNPTGKLDAKTLQQLGLGSQTTGVAAPLPPVSSSAVTTRGTQTARRQP